MLESLPLIAWPHRQTLTTLIFHRVLIATDPFRPDEPDSVRFDQFMGYIADNFAVLPLREAIDRMRHSALPHRACCITFDDGYSDNLTVALPILEKYRLPATVFVATGYLDGGRMFNDAVTDSVAQTKKEIIDLQLLGLGQYPVMTAAEKREAIDSILRHIKYSLPELREKQVAGVLEATSCDSLPTDIMLTSDQVRELFTRGVEIGGHTVSHNILTTLDDKRVLEEMVNGKRQLESIIEKPVTSFAYPNGKPGRDYSKCHVPIVKAAGFDLAVSTARGVGVAKSDIFQLPRFTPWGTSLYRKGWQMVINARTAI